MFEILTFLDLTWQNIIGDLAVGLVLFCLSNYAIKRYIATAERERLKHAKNNLIDILEELIISKRDISIDKINNLIKAIEREQSVVLTGIISPSSLLQDIELRFEKSHYLDHTQKAEYYELIQNQIQEIRKKEEPLIIPKKYSEIIETLTEEIRSKNTEKSLENLELLKKKINEREGYISGIGMILIPTHYFAFLIFLIYLALKLLNVGFVMAIIISFTITIVVMILNSIITDLLNVVLKKKK